MTIRKTRFKGHTSLRGRPKEQASAEIMLMKAEYSLQERKRKRSFFITLDILAIISLAASIYSFYTGKIQHGFLTLLPGALILGYFLLKIRMYKPKKNDHRKPF